MEDVRVRAAEMRDLPWLEVFDGHLDGASLRTKLALGELFIAEIDGDRVGMLRLDYLWSSVPFIALVRVAKHVRRQGAGRALVAHVGDHVRSGGGDVLFSSSTADEAEPQPGIWPSASRRAASSRTSTREAWARSCFGWRCGEGSALPGEHFLPG
jgi:GNAT superfamily N-acetyltransferase